MSTHGLIIILTFPSLYNESDLIGISFKVWHIVQSLAFVILVKHCMVKRQANSNQKMKLFEFVPTVISACLISQISCHKQRNQYVVL